MMKQTLCAVTLLTAGASHAAGFLFDTHSARATGLSYATVASIDDSAAVVFNAANILAVEKLDITVGDITTIPNLEFTPTGGKTQAFDTTIIPPPHLFAAYRINEKMAAGIGVYVPFAAGSNWPDDFVARTRGYKAQLATYFINPTYAYQLHERLRVGVGLTLIRGTVGIERKINFVESEGTVEVGGAGWGFGYNAGLQFNAVDKLLSIGAHFRGPSKMSFNGNADFRDIPTEFQSQLTDQEVSAAITLPGTTSVGLAFTPTERLMIAFDANLVLWSSIKDFTIEFADPSLTNPLPKNWENTWNFRLGMEYGVTENLHVRVGASYDPTPSPGTTLSPDLPDADRYKASVGLGYAFNPVRLDLGYQYIFLGDTETTVPGLTGTFSGDGHVFGFTLGYAMK